MRKLVFVLAALPAAYAQAPTVAPPIIQIVSRPGNATGPTRAYAGKAAIDVLGLAAATGVPQTWMVEMHPTFASIEDLDKAISSIWFPPGSESVVPPQDDLAGPPRTMIALFRPDWSYRADEGARTLPRARWIRVTIHRIHAGLEGDFEQLVRLRKATIESQNLDRPELAYHVISGAPVGTYLMLSPILSLRAMDEGVADVPEFAAPVADARAKAAPKAADIVIGQEHLLFRVEPRLSYVSDDFAAVDRVFWRGAGGQ